MKTLLLAVFFLLSSVLAFLVAVPGPVSALAWNPPEAPRLIGALQPNEQLKQAQLIATGQVYGPEDIAIDKQGRIYGGTQDGKIIRVRQNGKVETFVKTGGRPLGLHFDAQQNLIVADAFMGLLSINQRGDITRLTDEAAGTPFAFTNDLDIASDGTIYFSDASTEFDQAHYKLDLFNNRPNGRLLSYQPATGKTTVLLDNLYFANGVALSKNEDFVLVNETWRYRIVRYWLKGEHAGTKDVFIDNLPGFPDGISSNRQGTFWLALPTVRNQQMDKIHPYPALLNLSARLPDALHPQPAPYGLVLALNEKGDVVQSLHDTDGKHIKQVTSVEEYQGAIYLGTLDNDRIGRLLVVHH